MVHQVSAMGPVLLPVVLFLVLSVSNLHAQQASLTGRVVDPSGAALPGAAVSVTNVDTGIRTAVVTDGEGHYTIPLLPPGRYRITVDLSGFRSQTKSGLELAVQQTARYDFKLDLGALAETVDVRTPLVESQTSALGHVIDNTQIRDLPLNGRNPLELSRLTPGVTLLATAFLDTRNFNLTSVSINGGQGGSNAVLLDGGSTTLPERNRVLGGAQRRRRAGVSGADQCAGGGIRHDRRGSHQSRYQVRREPVSRHARGIPARRCVRCDRMDEQSQQPGEVATQLPSVRGYDRRAVLAAEGARSARLRWAQPNVFLLQLRRHSPKQRRHDFIARADRARTARRFQPDVCSHGNRRFRSRAALRSCHRARQSCRRGFRSHGLWNDGPAWSAPGSGCDEGDTVRIRSRTGPRTIPPGAIISSAMPGRLATPTSTTSGSTIRSVPPTGCSSATRRATWPTPVTRRSFPSTTSQTLATPCRPGTTRPSPSAILTSSAVGSSMKCDWRSRASIC